MAFLEEIRGRKTTEIGKKEGEKSLFIQHSAATTRWKHEDMYGMHKLVI